MMKKLLIATVVFAAICTILDSTPAYSQGAPTWSHTNSVKKLNAQRSNDTYEFIYVDTWGNDINYLWDHRLDTLVQHIAAKYELSTKSFKVDTLMISADSIELSDAWMIDDVVSAGYRISYIDQAKADTAVFEARLVDQATTFDMNANVSYTFTLYQMYAVSMMNVEPLFDEFTLEQPRNGAATLRSIIPGWGQIYKGQVGKGLAIIGLEAAAAVSGIAYLSTAKNKWHRLANENPGLWENYYSKEVNCRGMATISFGIVGAVYLYNLIDAAIVDAPRKIVVKKRRADSPEITMTPVPVITDDYVGAGIAFRF